MLWINEGFVLDDADNLLATSYVDLRGEGERTPILTLVRGCRREHALEDGETLLISKPERFREFGTALIRDDQEGFAREESIAFEAETPEEAAKRRATSDINEALELVGSRSTHVVSTKSSRQRTDSKSLSYGKDWWIFCASIEPEEASLDEWKASLDDDYDHVSEIGQPAKFAQALARMVTEQIGPLEEEAWFSGTAFGNAGARTRHKCQSVIHGPVVYTDRLYDMLSAEDDEVKRMAMRLFAKPATHAVQREYRFVVPNGGAADQTALLRISGMMRDALARTKGGLMRRPPAAAEMVEDDGSPMSRPVKGSEREVSRRRTLRTRNENRQESRSEVRDNSGQVLSTDIERQETIAESVATEDHELDDREVRHVHPFEEREHAEPPWPVPEVGQEAGGPGDEEDEDSVAMEVADGEREWNDEFGGEGLTIPVVLRGSGRRFASVDEMFRDPTAPMRPFAGTWEATACSPEEIVKSHGAAATLAMKITRVSVKHRRDAASACWHALQCINRIYAVLGDIVDSVWIERERFVVIHLEKSKELNATGRIVIGPSGAYAYCLKTSGSENLGYSEGNLGELFFPLSHVKTFESFGWPGKLEKGTYVGCSSRMADRK